MRRSATDTVLKQWGCRNVFTDAQGGRHIIFYFDQTVNLARPAQHARLKLGTRALGLLRMSFADRLRTLIYPGTKLGKLKALTDSG